MDILKKVRQYGIAASFTVACRRAKNSVVMPFYRRKHKHAPIYRNPSEQELEQIEKELRSSGIPVRSLTISPSEFAEFQKHLPFPSGYFSRDATLRNEKLLEHFIAYKLGNLARSIPSNMAAGDRKGFFYLDVAGCGSPWVQVLNEKGVNATCIDLKVSPIHRHLNCYQKMDATHTAFDAESVDVVSLQCAYEMFIGNQDTLFINECARILKPGGKAIIVPLYMHTHYCGYSSPRYYGKGFADPGAFEYVRMDSSEIPFSRKYDVGRLGERVISRAEQQGLACVIYVVQNKETLGEGVYCHFVLEMTKKPFEQPTAIVVPSPELARIIAKPNGRPVPRNSLESSNE